MLSPAITSRLWQHTIAAGFLIALLASPAQATEILAVTDTRHPMQNLGNTRLIELDRASLIEAELAAKLPQDPARAAIIVQQRLREGGTALQQRINEAYQDVVDAWSLGITTLPAVIVDQRYVVYGEPDITRAVELINTHKRTQP
ncbi:TIGR03757 family integrating conjugative element protein [Pectobacterium versatile]|uniref:TIGR03757 family integrating conjugative element protein n=1 Tax=Pectobacterium versatile TaxID=2488639 RepID=UPI001B38E93D|nr:TIGR03757 family integrating conjugative element protein [Pectobacterium versatile]MBQ4775599.1 TIGR03757 family integrating conjugative element protein [Pectobacterium versatile]